MKTIRMTLRWRITLLTIAVMLLSSISLVVLININMAKIMPDATDTVISATLIREGAKPVENTDTGADTGTDTDADADADTDAIERAIATQDSETETVALSMLADTIVVDTMANASLDMYWGSIFILMITLVLGGIGAFLISSSALRPIKNFSENIKRVNANNFTANLPMDGPQDEIRELTMSFNAMLAKLDNSFSSQKRFNASIAHELKTPLAVVKANIDVLNDQDEKQLDDYRRTLAIVEQTVNKMNALVGALLITVEQEQAPLNDEIHVDDLLSDVAEDLKLIAENKGVRFSCDTSTVSVVLGNEVLLYRAIYNIVENAIKYTIPNGSVSLNCSERNHRIEIQISDTGIGMPSEQVDRIFEPFYRIKNNCEQAGLGLGLAMSKSVVDRHRGEIKVTSEPGKGTRFNILIPTFTP